ncbi:ABC transporter permease [Flavisolibacter sp. BT320]|nr:ABC transporter permease [Flavisolibacter longurius]
MRKADILTLSIRTIRSNKLRSAITIAIIALGITALVGIITAIQAMNQKLTESFSTMGANGFTIRFKERSFRVDNRRNETEISRRGARQEKRSNLGQRITQKQAEAFREIFTYPATVGLSTFSGSMFSVATSAKRLNPTVSLFGVDENYLELNGVELAAGRNFIRQEIRSGAETCLLGHDVAEKLFGENTYLAVGKEVRIQNKLYRVIGVLKSRGSLFGFSRDNIALVGYKNLVRNFRFNTFLIGVKAQNLSRVEEAMGEAEGTFRQVRKLSVTEGSNFLLERNNSLAQRAINSLRYITIAVTLIGFITLIGAAIGLMNIMLVSVAERTKEVGLLKAIGAKKASIRFQFLSEAVLISIIGALIGIGLGIALGNLFGLLLQTNFVVPWNWIVYGVIICTVVGLVAGIYPALKAGNLNPIEALRYE